MDINQARNGHAIGNDIHERIRRRLQDGAYGRHKSAGRKLLAEVEQQSMWSVAKNCKGSRMMMDSERDFYFQDPSPRPNGVSSNLNLG